MRSQSALRSLIAILPVPPKFTARNSATNTAMAESTIDRSSARAGPVDGLHVRYDLDEGQDIGLFDDRLGARNGGDPRPRVEDAPHPRETNRGKSSRALPE